MNRLTTYLTQSNMLFNDYFESTGAGIGASNALRKVTNSEVSHYGHIFEVPWLQNPHAFVRNKVAHVDALLYDLDCQMCRVNEDQRPCLKL